MKVYSRKREREKKKEGELGKRGKEVRKRQGDGRRQQICLEHRK